METNAMNGGSNANPQQANLAKGNAVNTNTAQVVNQKQAPVNPMVSKPSVGAGNPVNNNVIPQPPANGTTATSHMEKVYDLISKSSDGISDKDIQAQLSITNVYNYCRSLEKKGLIVRKEVRVSPLKTQTLNCPCQAPEIGVEVVKAEDPSKKWKGILTLIQNTTNVGKAKDKDTILEEALNDYFQKALQM